MRQTNLIALTLLGLFSATGAVFASSFSGKATVMHESDMVQNITNTCAFPCQMYDGDLVCLRSFHPDYKILVRNNGDGYNSAMNCGRYIQSNRWN